ncbi:RNA polymerase sigma factor [candidate division KSB1 bacterium]|nr:MAG: RNA polymerase sigma factor [candidate division KSB1 bacterium]MBC6949885.1 RNA polymerase sigma factor [candidate division KSB1 bacterium]MCE7944250.1 RNA polymerase sigma factor [Chlorobi bacterium CHB1]MDL1876884.1 RNA polymerase sigma factor [Cytophagia bacterium CHB2]
MAQNPKVIDPDWIASRRPIVHYYLKKKWGLSGADLEEVTQETMFEALKSFHNYKGLNNAEPGTFLMGIANNVTQTFFRKRGRHQRRSAPLNFADSIGTVFRDEAEASDLARHLRAKISKLPKNYIQVLELIFYKGMKEGEAAKHLNLPPDKVYSLKSDALKRLRKLCLKDPIFRSLFYL